MHPTRRHVVLSLGALAATACTPDAPADSGKGGDTGLPPVDSADTGDSVLPVDTADTTIIDTAGEDTAVEATCEAPEVPAVIPGATLAQAEGPHWREGAPERSDLNVFADPAPVMDFKLRVVDGEGNPQAGVRVEAWMANNNGDYDDAGPEYNLRGYQFTAADGGACFRAYHPKAYGDGTLPAHFHIKLFIDDTLWLTTQLYFEDDPLLATLVVPDELVMKVEGTPETGQVIQYVLVIDPTTPTPEDDGIPDN